MSHGTQNAPLHTGRSGRLHCSDETQGAPLFRRHCLVSGSHSPAEPQMSGRSMQLTTEAAESQPAKKSTPAKSASLVPRVSPHRKNIGKHPHRVARGGQREQFRKGILIQIGNEQVLHR